MILRGECLACSRIATCADTSVDKVLNSYTCVLFDGVPEPVYMARLMMMEKYGAVSAIHAMLDRPEKEDHEGENT